MFALINRQIVTAILYAVIGWLCLFVTFDPVYATVIWVPSGFALAAALYYGPSIAIGIFIGAFIENLFARSVVTQSFQEITPDLAKALLIACGVTLQAIIGAFLLSRLTELPRSFANAMEVVRYGLISVSSSLISATVASVTLAVTLSLPQDEAIRNFVTWWVGDVIGVLLFTPVFLFSIYNINKLTYLRRFSFSMPFIVLFAAVAVFFLYSQKMDRIEKQQFAREQANKAFYAIEQEFDDVQTLTRTLVSLYRSSNSVSYQEFQEFVSYSLNAGHNIQYVSWAPYVKMNDVASYHQMLTEEGMKAPTFFGVDVFGKKQKWSEQRDAFPMTYIFPEDKQAAHYGLDLLSEENRKTALERAWITGDSVLSSNVSLLTGNADSAGFLWMHPIYHKTTDQENQNKEPHGVIVSAFLLTDILSKVLDQDEWKHTDVRIYDHADMLGEHQIYGNRGAIKANMYWTYEMKFGENLWYFVIAPGNDLFFELLSWGQTPVLLSGMMLSMIFSCLLLLLAKYREGMDPMVPGNGALIPQEIQKRIAEAETSKNEFLAAISHEIRTPMNGVIGMGQLLSDTELNPQQHSYVKAIMTSSKHMMDLLSDILDFSRIESGKLSLATTPFDMRELVEEVVRSVSVQAYHKKINIYLDYRISEENMILGDPTRIKQVLSNILENAVKFTEKGYVFFSVSARYKIRNDFDFVFTIRDTGIGIKEEDMDKMFMSFKQIDQSTTRKHEGTGLGLAISKKLIDMMQGELEVESVYERGSAFTVRLPLSRNASASQDEQQETQRPERKILVMQRRQMAQNLFKSLGEHFQVQMDIVENQQDAWRYIKTAVAMNMPYDAILLDASVSNKEAVDFCEAYAQDYSKLETCLVWMDFKGQYLDMKELQDKGVSGLIRLPLLNSDFENFLEILHKDKGAFIYMDKDDYERAIQGENAQHFTGREILVAEDNEINRTICQEHLEQFGCNVTIAQNGREAVSIFEKAPDRYELIFMDCQMPEMDGYEATRLIRMVEEQLMRYETDQVPIIALTARAMRGDRERCLDSGMNDYVAKPASPATLQSMLEKHLPEKKIMSEPAPTEAPKDDTASDTPEVAE